MFRKENRDRVDRLRIGVLACGEDLIAMSLFASASLSALIFLQIADLDLRLTRRVQFVESFAAPRAIR
jgi:hypothetical protein